MVSFVIYCCVTTYSIQYCILRSGFCEFFLLYVSSCVQVISVFILACINMFTLNMSKKITSICE